MDGRGELALELARFGRLLHHIKGQLGDLLPPGLDPAAAQLLSWLVKQGPSRQNDLAEGALLDPSTVSRRVSQLVQHGLVERRADQADGRAVLLHPTARGEELYEAIWTRRAEVVAEMTDRWTADEVAELVRLLARLTDDAEARRAQTTPTQGAPARER